jgi:hypothetical protein
MQIFDFKNPHQTLKLDDYIIARTKEYNEKYPEFANFADSLLIYREIKPSLKYLRNSSNNSAKQIRQESIIFLDDVIGIMLSTGINHYCMWEKGKILIADGQQQEGFKLLETVISKELNRFERDRLIREMAEYASAQNDYARIISSYRQLTDASFTEDKRLWVAYLELGYESDADLLYQKLIKTANASQKSDLRNAQYRFDLGRLKITDLNLVQARENVSLSGKLVNPTRKKYENVVIELTVYNADTRKSESFRHTVSLIYPETDSEFKEYSSYKSVSQDLKVSGKVISFSKVF